MKTKHLYLNLITFILMAVILQACADSNVSIEADEKPTFSAEILPGFAQKTLEPSPSKVYENFVAMVDTVQTMSRKEIETLSDEEILKLGDPILIATEKTIKLSKDLLHELEKPLQIMAHEFKNMSIEEHKSLSASIESILEKNLDQVEYRNLSVKDIRKILSDYSEKDDGVMQMSSSCSTTFNVQNGYVLLYPGDNLHLANSLCPSSSTFYVHSGTYSSQYVQYSKSGNTWVGVGTNPIIMDGQNSIDRAFYEGLNNNSISWIEIKNYTHHGIYSDDGSADGLSIRNMTFKNISPNHISGLIGTHGQEHGAIMIQNADDIEVRDCYFNKVASSIRVRNSSGPIKVLDNEALNSGRNFFQCGNCKGAGIRINGNSMDRTSAYGDAILEDWINLYESEGTSSDWIQVNNNRARGHSNSGFGSFTILGDEGGKNQEAIGNIGVSSGQVGIGVAGGHNIKVINNNMYSAQWNHSNVAFYSADFSPGTCSNHQFPASPDPNVANWKCGDPGDCNPVGVQNHAHSDGNCGITKNQIRTNVLVDTTMGPGIWNQW